MIVQNPRIDPLSQVLSLLRIKSYASGGFDAGGAWSIAFGPHAGINFYAAVSGACWLSVEGVKKPVRVEAGDCLLLPRGRGFRVASDLRLRPVLLPGWGGGMGDGSVIRRNGGGDFFSVGGYFTLAGEHAHALVTQLPPLIHIRREADKETLRWCIEQMRRELGAPQPGRALMGQQLATILLIQALRIHLSENQRGVGWLFALSDAPMAAALAAMHGEPGRRWTLQSLAARVGMSRTAFTLRFKETAGVSPIEYLTRWRMTLASDRLTREREPIGAIARDLGYASESAFSTAFKRVMGSSPRRYRG